MTQTPPNASTGSARRLPLRLAHPPPSIAKHRGQRLDLPAVAFGRHHARNSRDQFTFRKTIHQVSVRVNKSRLHPRLRVPLHSGYAYQDAMIFRVKAFPTTLSKSKAVAVPNLYQHAFYLATFPKADPNKFEWGKSAHPL
jgi:hypothetical protein